MITKTISMNLKREVKHSVLYEAINPDGPLQSIYVKKSMFNGEGFPMEIKVTIEVVNLSEGFKPIEAD